MKNASEMTPIEALDVLRQTAAHDSLAMNLRSHTLAQAAISVLEAAITPKEETKKDAPAAK